MQLDLDRRIERLRSQGRDIVVSFGGRANTDLGDACSSTQALVDAYSQVVHRYKVNTIDLDIEGEALSNPAAIMHRAEAVHTLQRQASDGSSQLAVWLTLPVSPSGLTEEGLDVVRAFLDEGVDITGVNAMTKNFGTSDSLMQTSVESLKNLHEQLQSLYRESGSPLGDTTIWREIGDTPIIGQNDIASGVFTLDGGIGLNNFAQEAGREPRCQLQQPGELTLDPSGCSGAAKPHRGKGKDLGFGKGLGRRVELEAW